jgi:hypothetical protein
VKKQGSPNKVTLVSILKLGKFTFVKWRTINKTNYECALNWESCFIWHDCLTLSENFFSYWYVMMKNKIFLMRRWWCLLCPRPISFSWIFNSANLLKLQCSDTLLYYDTLYWLQANQTLTHLHNRLWGETEYTNLIVFGFTHLGIKATIYCTQNEYTKQKTRNIQ